MAFLSWSSTTDEKVDCFMHDIIGERLPIFNRKFEGKYYSTEIDELFIVFECFEEKDLSLFDYKERKYISWKNRYADIRLYVNYTDFLCGNTELRTRMIYDTICRAAEIVSTRVKSFKKDEFIADLKTVFF